MAALAGVDISVAKKGLVNLANVIGGDLEVSKEGEAYLLFELIVYSWGGGGGGVNERLII